VGPVRTALTVSLVVVATGCAGGDDSGRPSDPQTLGPASTTTLAFAAALCDAPPPEQRGTVEPDGLVELSGLAASRRHPGELYAHNDSGDVARLFVIDGTGRAVDEVTVAGVTPFDWEDLALHDDVLYVGDIGDNARARSEIVVARVAEADIRARDATATTIPLSYPDGPHDAEALMVDPVAEQLVVVTKEPAGTSGVYVTPLADPGALELVATLDLGVAELVTAGDISSDGALLALRTYGAVLLWERRAGEPIADALARDPCRAPSAREPQGEALALTADGYMTISEGEHPPVWAVTTAGGPTTGASAPGTSPGR